MFGVVFGQVGLFDGTGILGGLRKVSLDDEVLYLAQAGVAREGDGVLAADIEAVVVLGIVRGGHHGPARLPEVPDGEVERVGRDEPEVEHVRSSLRDALYEGLLQRLAREAHVAGHDDPGAFEVEVLYEGAADVACHVLVQILRIHATDVVSLEYGLVEHLLPPDSLRRRIFGIRYNSGLWFPVQTGS